MLRSLDASSLIVNRKLVRERDYSVELQRSGPAILPALYHNFHLVTVYVGGGAFVARRNRARRSFASFSIGETSIRPAGPGEVVEWHGGVHCLHIHIHPRLLRRTAEARFGRASLAFDPQLKLRDTLIREIGLELNDALGREKGTHRYVHELVTALSLRLLEGYAAAETPPAYVGRLSVEEILDTLRDAHPDWEGVAALAQRAGLTRWHFSRRVRALAGISPYESLQRSRIESAKHLLERGRESLSAVAYAMGFADQSHLTRAFRQVTGMTPAQYRSGRGAM